MTIQPAPRTVTLTIWKLEADMIDITTWGRDQAAHVIGRIHAHARGEGIDHRQEVQAADRVCIGDTYTIELAPPRAGNDAPPAPPTLPPGYRYETIAPREPVGPNPGVPETGRHRKDRR